MLVPPLEKALFHITNHNYSDTEPRIASHGASSLGSKISQDPYFLSRPTLLDSGIHFGLEKHPEPGHLLTLQLIQLGTHVVADEI